MGTTTETRISSTQAKDAIYKAHSISSSASEINETVLMVGNVKNYGVVGDGITDDTLALQTIINNNLSLNGGSIDIPNGTYKIYGSLNIPKAAGFRIRGQSRNGVKIVQSKDNEPIFYFTKENTATFLIEHMTLSWTNLQPATNTRSVGIYFHSDTETAAGFYNYEIRHVKFERGYRGIADSSLAQTACWGFTYDMLSFSRDMSGSAISHKPYPSIGQPNNRIGSIYVRADSIVQSEPIIAIRACGTTTIQNLEVNQYNNGNQLIDAQGGTSIIASSIRIEKFNMTTPNVSLIYVPSGTCTIGKFEMYGSYNNIDIGAGNKCYIFSGVGGSYYGIKVGVLNVSATLVSGNMFVFQSGGIVDFIQTMNNIYLTDLIATNAANNTTVMDWILPRLSSNRGDANVVLAYTGGSKDVTTQLFTTNFTANRTITFPDGQGGSNSNLFNGCYFEIISKNTAAYTLTLKEANGSVIYTIPASTKMRVKVMYSKFSWTIVESTVLV